MVRIVFEWTIVLHESRKDTVFTGRNGCFCAFSILIRVRLFVVHQGFPLLSSGDKKWSLFWNPSNKLYSDTNVFFWDHLWIPWAIWTILIIYNFIYIIYNCPSFFWLTKFTKVSFVFTTTPNYFVCCANVQMSPGKRISTFDTGVMFFYIKTWFLLVDVAISHIEYDYISSITFLHYFQFRKI